MNVLISMFNKTIEFLLESGFKGWQTGNKKKLKLELFNFTSIHILANIK